jgi:hypothetical protein
VTSCVNSSVNRGRCEPSVKMGHLGGECAKVFECVFEGFEKGDVCRSGLTEAVR